MLRIIAIALLTAAGVLALANLLVFISAREAETPPTTTAPVTAPQRWQAMPMEERSRLVERYRSIVARENARAVLQQARQFAQLPLARQEFLRRLHSVLVETIARQPLARRTDLLHYPPAAQAYFVYQYLVTDDPQMLAELAHQANAVTGP